jgi:hypothetical protein
MDMDDDIPFYSKDDFLLHELDAERQRANGLERELNRLEALVRQLKHTAEISKKIHLECADHFERLIYQIERRKDLTKSVDIARHMVVRLRTLTRYSWKR